MRLFNVDCRGWPYTGQNCDHAVNAVSYNLIFANICSLLIESFNHKFHHMTPIFWKIGNIGSSQGHNTGEERKAQFTDGIRANNLMTTRHAVSAVLDANTVLV